MNFQKGNELDEKVAEEIMGWKKTKFRYIHNLPSGTAFSQSTSFGCSLLIPENFEEIESDKFRFEVPDVPLYSQSLDRALDVVERLNPDDECFELVLSKEVNEGFSGYHATLNGVHAQAENISKAICLAALKGRGKI